MTLAAFEYSLEVPGSCSRRLQVFRNGMGSPSRVGFHMKAVP
jgi:hypothetical protein